MANTIKEALQNKEKGFHIGRRLVLPFHCQLIKLIVDKEIYTEFVGSNDVKINQDPLNTSLYFRSAGNLSHFIDTYQVVKLIVAELDSDLCNQDTHIKLVCEIKENHVVDIYGPNEDILFIE